MSELKEYLCVEALVPEKKEIPGYLMHMAKYRAPQAEMELVYLKSEADKVIAELEENHKKEVEMLSTYCREQTEKLCIEMTVVDSLEQNLKKLNRTIWLCRAWAARNLALYYKLWCKRYKDNSNESLASCYLDDSKKWESFYHKFKALADKFKEEA